MRRLPCVYRHATLLTWMAHRWQSTSIREGDEIEESVEEQEQQQWSESSDIINKNSKWRKEHDFSKNGTHVFESTVIPSQAEMSKILSDRRKISKETISAFEDDIEHAIQNESKYQDARPTKRSCERAKLLEQYREGEDQKWKQWDKEKHSLVYNVPILTPHVLGREKILRELWQNILSNVHCQVITGVNGMGKSTILAEFCNCVRSNDEFTCIKWFELTPEPVKAHSSTLCNSSAVQEDASSHRMMFVGVNHQSCQIRTLRRELASFVKVIKERVPYSKVLLVFDNVHVPEYVLSLLLKHDNLFIVITSCLDDPFSGVKKIMSSTHKAKCEHENTLINEETANSVNWSFNANCVKVVRALPLESRYAAKFATMQNININNNNNNNDNNNDMMKTRALFAAIRHVPLLMFIALRMIDHRIIDPETLQQKLEYENVIGRSSYELSISRVTQVMCNIITDTLISKYYLAADWLALMSCLNCNNISSNVLITLCHHYANHYTNNMNERNQSCTNNSNLDSYYCNNNNNNNNNNYNNKNHTFHNESNNNDQTAIIKEFIGEVEQLGLLCEAWEGNTYRIHPTIQYVFQQKLNNSLLDCVAEALLHLWPRRRGRLGEMSIAVELVRHTQYLVQLYIAQSIEFSPTLLTCMDRSATYLCHYTGQQLDDAAELWYAIHEYYVSTLTNNTKHSRALKREALFAEQSHLHEQNRKQEKEEPEQKEQEHLKREKEHNQSAEHERQVETVWTHESVRIARECGRLLCKLHDPRAEYVLYNALKQACQLYGSRSTQVGLILGCLASYLPATHHNIQLLHYAACAIDDEIEMVEEVRSEEERRMLLETLFIVLVRQGQLREELKEDIPIELVRRVEHVHKLLSQKESQIEV